MPTSFLTLSYQLLNQPLEVLYVLSSMISTTMLLALHVVLLALGPFLAIEDGVVEFLFVDLAVVAGGGVEDVLELGEDLAFQDVVLAPRTPGPGRRGRNRR